MVEIRLRSRLHEVRRGEDVDRYQLGDRPGRDDDTSIEVHYRDDGEVGAVELRRPAHSYVPVFWHRTPSDELVVSDTMGFLHDVVGGGRGEPSTEAQLRHLVFGRPPTTGLFEDVEVVDHGRRVRLERGGDGWEVVARESWDRLQHDDAGDWRDGLGEFADRLEESVDSVEADSILFSGGVDSTLLGSLADGDLDKTTARIPGEEFAPEVQRARWAADLLGGDHRVVDLDHSDYLGRLVETTRRTGRPCPAMQHVLQTKAAGAAGDCALYGELGDGTYGFPIIDRPELRRWVRESDLGPAEAASRRFSLASMRREDHDFDGEFRRVYGPVDEVHRERARRVRRLVDWSDRLVGADRRWEQFLICGHATDFLTVGCIRFVRDFASSTGTVIRTPYMDRPVMDQFHRFDPATRYRDGGRMKPVLKRLLERRVEGYDVDRPKLASGLPRSWYFTEGPLADAFEKFPPPSPMDEAVGRAVDNPEWNNSWLLWPALSYSVWYRTWFESGDVDDRPDCVVHNPGPSTDCSPEIPA